MEHLEAIGKIIAIVGPILLGLLWVLKRIEKRRYAKCGT